MSFLHAKSSNTTVNVSGGGGSGSTTAIENTFVSSGAISAHVALYADEINGILVANPSILTQQDRIIGVTKTSAAASGETVTFVAEGLLVDPSFTFTPGPVYVGSGGSLTQVKPTSDLLIQIGIAISLTELLVSIKPSIRLA